MARPASSQPTAVELQILRILWELGPSPVREIHARLEADKGTSYSTTVKMLSVMLDKGLVRRDEEAAPHIYHAAMMDPHTSAELDLDQIWSLVDDLLAAHGDWLPAWALVGRKTEAA